MVISDFKNATPEVYQALGSIGKAAVEAGLEKDLIEFVKIRASQINGCAYCLGFHTAMARKAGVSQVKLDLLPIWREAGLFNEREQAALAWTETLVLMAQAHPGAEDRAKAANQFNEMQFLHLTVAIGLINQWNRICGGLGILPDVGMLA
ncbi:MAG TPA: carboxymuconolactone decarboxylase family protein [bacterium]|jgi:AhpD family alkylhydroperoxidase|nr:carboxymuconolactone decarboxylase family protein [bacterium]